MEIRKLKYLDKFRIFCFIRHAIYTTISIRMNQYPNEIGSASARSQILRKFRRFTQTMLLEMIYKSNNQTMPKNPYKDSPPGWYEYEPKIEFGNISNLKSGEENIFNKMVFLLQNKSQKPLPSDWEELLKNYNNLNEKREQKESKKALEIWMLQAKLIPLLQEYSKEVDVPSEEIMKHCSDILLKSTYVDQFLDYLKSNKWNVNAGQQCQFKQADEESNDEMLSCTTSQDKESLEPGAKKSECTRASNHRYGENQSMEILHSSQNLELCQEQSKKQSNGDKLNCMENIDYKSSDDQRIQTHPKEIDLSTFSSFSSEIPFLSSDCDPLQQISSKYNLGIDPVSSEVNPSLENMDTSCDDDQDKISNFDTLSEKDYDELAIDIFEPDSLQKYLKELENNHPSPRMVTLCNDILKKDHGHIDSHKDFF
ncbi:uncharacterized protein LOC134271649 [Saccostrea cucullata]|uniref:uncharacterized protein LOC134271649 n=1 Tax=Saccostrea cuccullata TaxID=36930 RepID=UPI002ED69996